MLLCYLGVVRGYSPSSIADLLKLKTLRLIAASWTLWPLVHLFNYLLVPIRIRLFFFNCVQIVFNTMVSGIVH